MKKNIHSLMGVSFVFVISFLLNFLWEAIHAVLFYEGHADYPALFFVKMLLYASFFDAVFISVIFLAGCYIWKGSSCWIKNFNKKKLFFTIIAGLIIASLIELRAMIYKRWSYNELMPTILGLGVSPLLQLSVTGSITFYLASIFFYKVIE